jgi:hypothetical protein
MLTAFSDRVNVFEIRISNIEIRSMGWRSRHGMLTRKRLVRRRQSRMGVLSLPT